MAIMHPSLRLFLRKETAALHQHLESLPLQAVLQSPDCDPESYFCLLQSYADALAPVEPALTALNWPAELTYEPRLPLLCRDLGLDRWHLNPDEAIESCIPASRAWGMRYVIEGMALGSRWLLARAPVFQQPWIQSRCQFFQMKASRWPAFCESLEQNACDLDWELASQGACAMFQGFISATQRWTTSRPARVGSLSKTGVTIG